MNHVMKTTKALTKILEVLHWIGATVMAAVAVCAAAAPQWLKISFSPDSGADKAAVVYGYRMELADASGQLNMPALVLAAVCAVVLYSCTALIFRNIHFIIQRSESGSPFQEENIRRLRRIGVFSISIPFIGLLASAIIPLAMGSYQIQLNLKLDSLIMGFIVLSLTRIFAYGASLEKDVDGLL